MRTHVWLAALVITLGFALRTHAQSPIVISKQNVPQAQKSYFTPLPLTSFVQSAGKFLNFFPAVPSINQVSGRITRSSIPLTNGQAGADYFSAAAAAAAKDGNDLPAIAGAVRAATGRKGADLYMPLRVALTGRAHGPELAPLLKAMPPGKARERLARFA